MSGRCGPIFAAYVRGHDRVWGVDRMRGVAEGDGEVEVKEEVVEWSSGPGPASFGVGVARTLEFHHGPGSRTVRAELSTDG